MVRLPSGEVVVVAVCAAGAVVAAIKTAVGLAGDLPLLGPGFVVAGVAAVAVGLPLLLVGADRAGGSTQRGTRHRVEFHGGGDIRTARLHEAGHAAMVEHYGGRVIGLTVRADGSGRCDYEMPGYRAAQMDGIDWASISYAGAVAAREPIDGAPCRSDRASAREEIRTGFTWSGRGRADRQARGIARRHVGHGVVLPKGRVARWERRVQGPR